MKCQKIYRLSFRALLNLFSASGLVLACVCIWAALSLILELGQIEMFGGVGDDVKMYDAEWKKRPTSILVSEGLITLSENEKLDGEEIRVKTQMDRYRDGTDAIPARMKLEDGKDSLSMKTWREMYADREITDEKAVDFARMEIRTLRAAAFAVIDDYERKTLRAGKKFSAEWTAYWQAWCDAPNNITSIEDYNNFVEPIKPE